MFYQDILAPLNQQSTIKQKLVHCHEMIRQFCPFISRISVNIYDAKTRMLKTYLYSGMGDDPMAHYQVSLDDAPSLQQILQNGHPRVINDMEILASGQHEHTRRLGKKKFAASYTLPMIYNNNFFGFIFFNSDRKETFTPARLNQIDVYAHLISLMVIDELSTLHSLTAAISTASHITFQRDPETGNHLERMSRYSHLIARTIASSHRLDDDYIEHIFMFSPLHDIGKVAIPDRILLKKGSLTAEERLIMNTHTSKGREIIDNMISNFNLTSLQHLNILRNIAQYHHEAVNGAGYPEGREGDDIPIEARIVAVADVFDALTNERPYKSAWHIDDACEALQQSAGKQLDEDCVQALLNNRPQVETIMQQFAEHPTS